MTTRPRHEEIAEYLRDLAHDTEPDGRMPSDAELCERFGVSRMTARQAVQSVVNEGLVYRKRGHGTFRSHNRIHRVLGSPLSFTENMRVRGLTPSSKLLTFEKIAGNPEDAAALEVDESEGAYVLERLRFADQTPMALERAVITPRCPSVMDADLSKGSLHQLFESLGHTPMRATASVSARRPTKRERELLKLPSSGIVLVEHRVIYDQANMPLEHTTTGYVADRYAFDAELYRSEGESGT